MRVLRATASEPHAKLPWSRRSARNLKLPPRTRTRRTVTAEESLVLAGWRPSSYLERSEGGSELVGGGGGGSGRTREEEVSGKREHQQERARKRRERRAAAAAFVFDRRARKPKRSKRNARSLRLLKTSHGLDSTVQASSVNARVSIDKRLDPKRTQRWPAAEESELARSAAADRRFEGGKENTTGAFLLLTCASS